MKSKQCLAYNNNNIQCKRECIESECYCKIHIKNNNNFNKQNTIKSFIKYNIIKDLSKNHIYKFNYKESKFIIKQKKRLTYNFTKCAICNTYITKYNKNIDHLIPISKGGIDIEQNKVLLCKRCNILKSNINTKKELFKLINSTSLNNIIKNKKKYAFKNLLKFRKKITIPKTQFNEYQDKINIILPIIITLLYNYCKI